MRGRGWLGFTFPILTPALYPCLPSEFCPQDLFLERTQPRKTVMMKLVRSTGRIQVMCLMAGAEELTLRGASAGDAVRKVRVKPLSRPLN